MLQNRQVNLHTHTPMCHHAIGTVEEFCTEALRQNIAVLGFSDHGPFPDRANPGERMDLEEIPLYLKMLDEAEKLFPQLTLLKGFEIDYVPGFPKIREIYHEQYPTDYLIGSVHRAPAHGREIFFCEKNADFDEETVLTFLRASIECIESGLFDAIGHPDAITKAYFGTYTKNIEKTVRELAIAAKQTGIPLEVNANGIRKGMVRHGNMERYCYPWLEFWQTVAEADAPVIVGCDAHTLKNLGQDGTKEQTYEFAESLHLRIVNAEFAQKIIRNKS